MARTVTIVELSELEIQTVRDALKHYGAWCARTSEGEFTETNVIMLERIAGRCTEIEQAIGVHEGGRWGKS